MEQHLQHDEVNLRSMRHSESAERLAYSTPASYPSSSHARSLIPFFLSILVATVEGGLCWIAPLFVHVRQHCLVSV